ncbi:MAG: hypothetical protein Greene041619_675 [Candidatus Peregrinibacteria bacterium Greene0416_19]|nr:MAG: hypothetical protein Greene041619_675 [Candidatus Peregrinibacteria bacterium Greene0416_19]
MHPVHERAGHWYLFAGAALIAALLYGAITGAWTFAIVALLIAALYWLLRRSPPVTKVISIAAAGYTFDGGFTAWNDCEGFWIVRTPAYAELHIRRKTPGWNREVSIQTGDIDMARIRAQLSQFLEEQTDRKEYLIDRIIRLCKL